MKFGFMAGKSITEAIFSLRQLIETQREDEIRREAPWKMMFTDDTLICASRKLDESPRVSWEKTEYLCAEGGTVEPRYMLGEVLPRAQEFKYMRLNSTGRRWSRKSDKKDVNDWSS
ncbi:uncharacterized protein LOC119578701 [Penaeus monodon]|uniref:uncharacterized protein LOC119578701 n=1 Tax=Penaeus monodon TaxID=6687 RepID=UPI0018A75B2E|nr:uncharacterized protein LOC119578701 [Penaeus monodon]